MLIVAGVLSLLALTPANRLEIVSPPKLQDEFNQGEDDLVVKVKFIWGASEVDRSSASKWDPSDYGTIVWDSNFNLAPTANQERIRTICSELRASTLVKDSKVTCFMDDFKTYIEGQGGSFPVAEAQFPTKLKEFADSTDGSQLALKNFIGYSGSTLRVVMIESVAVIEPEQPYKIMNPAYQDWKSLVASMNSNNPSGLDNMQMSGGIYFANIETEKAI